MLDVDARIAKEAQTTEGVISRARLRSLGLSDRMIDGRIASGLLASVLPSIFLHSGSPETWRSRVRAAFLWAGEDALLTGCTALKLRGLDVPSEPKVDLYIQTDRRAPGILVRRSKDAPTTRRPLDGMWTTTIERALLDACSTHPPVVVGKAMDDALRKRLTTVDRLKKEVAAGAGRGRRGLATFRRLVAYRDPNDENVRSQMETRMLRILRQVRSHELMPNFQVVARGNKYYLDFAFPQVRLGIECHSRRFHATERVSADAARHRDLTLDGWAILYFTWDDIMFRRDDVLRDVKTALLSSLGH